MLGKYWSVFSVYDAILTIKKRLTHSHELICENELTYSAKPLKMTIGHVNVKFKFFEINSKKYLEIEPWKVGLK